ncbi:AAA family ATPase [Rhodococcus hoagii]|uniref:ATP-dependent nuclease n=1 Tax=Rhodococcus hoagii TaxID=43767 RepID=UPI00164331B0|nr:AAA family ATPase [Prescottella equi]NKR29280.1 AAA family ATPase [Prescottella equi]NKS61382.1 AAA family ATPase [Prescottella equi]
MRIKSVGIKNFRCLRDVRVEFDEVTSIIGPNGAGKSSILRALDWFFNGAAGQLSDEDVHVGAAADDRRIEVEVTFGNLTDRDRQALGDKYAPPGTMTFTAWRTWSAEDGVRTTGKARAYLPFEKVRALGSAAEKKTAYNEIATDLGLPKWKNRDDAEVAMEAWEREHPDQLKDAVVSDTHFFGFNGQNVMSGLFDYVLVTADLRASEESLDGRKTIIGRILEQAVDRSAADAEFEDLAAEVSKKYAEIADRHFGSQLADLGKALTEEVGALTSGREVHLHATPVDVRQPATNVNVIIADASIETSVDRQGHGFQRTLLISALKLLASRGSAANDGSVVLLAIEEPELFQHRSQERVFAKVLRELAADPTGGIQVAYATHSPVFVDPRFFDQVRRVSRVHDEDSPHPEVAVRHASMDAVIGRLDSAGIGAKAVRSRWDQVCTNALAEALFAEAVVLVEGDDDKAILDGVAGRDGQRQLEMDGITVACSFGKSGHFTPHAILEELSIPTLVVFDNDKGCGQRIRDSKKEKQDPDVEDRNHRKVNRQLLHYLGADEVDYPEGLVAPRVFAWSDRLEDDLDRDWPAWRATLDELVRDGRGAKGKNAATYALAARECAAAPSGAVLEVLSAARNLVVDQR